MPLLYVLCDQNFIVTDVTHYLMSPQVPWSIRRLHKSLCLVLLCVCGTSAIRRVPCYNKYLCSVCFSLTANVYVLPEQHTKGRMGHSGYLMMQTFHFKGVSQTTAYRLHLPSSSQTGHQYPVWLQLSWLSCKWSANTVFCHFWASWNQNKAQCWVLGL